MAVLRFVIPASVRKPAIRHASGVVIERWDARAGNSAVARLVDACRAADWPGPWVPTAKGLIGDLVSRGPRTVAAWLAWGSADDPCSEAAMPLGGIGLATARIANAARCSIPWLLVHPAHRRRGVATALVSRALGAAAEQAVEAVSVETLATWPAAGFWRTVAARFPPGR